MAKQCIITLLTDFGSADAYVAEMKGVLLTICPAAVLVDITHEVPPGDVLATALHLRRVLPCFPPGTVHVVVVDPGVGTDRRILAARYAGQTVVCPDNGAITLLDRDLPLEQIAVVRDERYFRPGPISRTFHGRDVMAPVAGHVAAGLILSRLGPPPDKIKLLEIPQPAVEPDGAIRGQVIHVDRFGNLITNIPVGLLPEELTGIRNQGVEKGTRDLGPGTSRPSLSPIPYSRVPGPSALGELLIFCAGKPVGPIRPSYGFVEPGQPLGVINSMWLLEIAVNGDSAAKTFSADVRAEVRVGPGSQ